jgi:hypothetical protein
LSTGVATVLNRGKTAPLVIHAAASPWQCSAENQRTTIVAAERTGFAA